MQHTWKQGESMGAVDYDKIIALHNAGWISVKGVIPCAQNAGHA